MNCCVVEMSSHWFVEDKGIVKINVGTALVDRGLLLHLRINDVGSWRMYSADQHSLIIPLTMV